jgi:hypothetical protein
MKQTMSDSKLLVFPLTAQLLEIRNTAINQIKMFCFLYGEKGILDIRKIMAFLNKEDKSDNIFYLGVEEHELVAYIYPPCGVRLSKEEIMDFKPSVEELLSLPLEKWETDHIVSLYLAICEQILKLNDYIDYEPDVFYTVDIIDIDGDDIEKRTIVCKNETIANAVARTKFVHYTTAMSERTDDHIDTNEWNHSYSARTLDGSNTLKVSVKQHRFGFDI